VLVIQVLFRENEASSEGLQFCDVGPRHQYSFRRLESHFSLEDVIGGPPSPKNLIGAEQRHSEAHGT
jgi:hypothetical protein